MKRAKRAKRRGEQTRGLRKIAVEIITELYMWVYCTTNAMHSLVKIYKDVLIKLQRASLCCNFPPRHAIINKESRERHHSKVLSIRRRSKVKIDPYIACEIKSGSFLSAGCVSPFGPLPARWLPHPTAAVDAAVEGPGTICG